MKSSSTYVHGLKRLNKKIEYVSQVLTLIICYQILEKSINTFIFVRPHEVCSRSKSTTHELKSLWRQQENLFKIKHNFRNVIYGAMYLTFNMISIKNWIRLQRILRFHKPRISKTSCMLNSCKICFLLST